MRSVLSVASECVPLSKTGGLADVAGALPGALANEGWEMRTLLPGYPALLKKTGKGKAVCAFDDVYGGPAEVRQVQAEGLSLFVLHAPHLFDRPGGPYLNATGVDWPDNPKRFAALSWVAARLASYGACKWRPEVVHGHDWQAGFAPLFLNQMDGKRPGTVLTIHNMAFLGMAPGADRAALRLPAEHFNQDGYEFWGQISALKAGLTNADKITTVSPSYARELLTPDFGAGLDGLLRNRSEDLVGNRPNHRKLQDTRRKGQGQS